MRYSVLGFNQEELLKNGLDLTDTLLLDYIYTACASPSMKRTHDDNDQPYVWLQHKKLLEDLPIIGIGEEALKKRLYKLADKGLLVSLVKNDEIRGRRTYYTITTQCEKLRFSDQVYLNTLSQERPSVSGYTSDNKLNIDNKLEDNFTNVKLEQPTVTPEQPKRRVRLVDTPNDIQDTDSVNKSARKKDLYTNCLTEIDKFTDDEEIRDMLKVYLPIRLSRRDIALNLPTFRGMLKRLSRVATTREDKINSIQKSIDKQYPTFYEVRQYNNRKKFAEGDGLKMGISQNEEIADEVF